FGLAWEPAYPNAQDFRLGAAAAFAAVADLDSDGDGFTNADELAAGKHPGDAASAPEPVNSPPTAGDGAAEANRGRAVEIVLLGADADGDALSYHVARPPDHGTVTIADGVAAYVPERGRTGPIEFDYIADDGLAQSAPATVRVTVVARTPWDTDDSGGVDILDLVTVARLFGAVGDDLAADVNGDGVVSIIDLVTVASHFGETDALAAPRLMHAGHASHVERWLDEAILADDGSDTFRRGIAMLRSLSGVSIPAGSSLGQNYPNPFNPETWIPFRLSQASDVTVRIYDVRGRVVRTLALGVRPAGQHVTRQRAAYWDGRDETGTPVASGVYLYRFATGQRSEIRRLVVAK
ncbi:T9SS type A sorting domain-containing protein, partial [Candidatus Poribacteria bacterium]|nr:T9SS type A sorting domain-containing protein [Candidatus Poribacteria bacterium]